MTWTQPEDYARAMSGLRGRIVAVGTIDGWPAAIAELEGGDVQTGWDAARLLCRLAEKDAQTPDVAALALWARSQCADEEDLARFLHAFVLERVRFAREPGERFAGTAATLYFGAGDCDDSARALYALARAAGLRARLCFLVQEEQPAHVYCQIGAGGQWHNAETTLPAQFGEHPLEAARRLGIQTRPDLSGKAMTLKTPIDLGGLGPTLIAPADGPNVGFYVRNGDRMRFVLAVGLLTTQAQIAAGMAAIGFSCVNVFMSLDELDPEQWPADFTNLASGADQGTMLAFVDAVYAGDAKELALAWDFATVRDVRLVTGEAPACPDGATPAPAQPAGPQPLTEAALPPLLPDPADGDVSSPRSPWLAAALAHAWFQAFGSDPAYPFNASLCQGILAICALETDMGRANWHDPLDAGGYSLRWNFGNLHAGMNPTNGYCPMGSKPHPDQRWDEAQNKYVTYTTCFQAFKSAVAGLVSLVKNVAGPGREDTRAALLAGDATAVAAAMAGHGYYDQHAQSAYAAALAAQAKVIAKNLGQPLAFAPGGPPAAGGTLGALAVLGLLAAGAAALFHYRGA